MSSREDREQDAYREAWEEKHAMTWAVDLTIKAKVYVHAYDCTDIDEIGELAFEKLELDDLDEYTVDSVEGAD